MATNEERVSSALERQKLAAEAVEEAKQKTEFSRYKQDCRKRALEMAQYTARDIGQWLEKNELKVIQHSPDGKETDTLVMPSELVKAELLIPFADKYYNWLISIPS